MRFRKGERHPEPKLTGRSLAPQESIARAPRLSGSQAVRRRVHALQGRPPCAQNYPCSSPSSPRAATSIRSRCRCHLTPRPRPRPAATRGRPRAAPRAARPEAAGAFTPAAPEGARPVAPADSAEIPGQAARAPAARAAPPPARVGRAGASVAGARARAAAARGARSRGRRLRHRRCNGGVGRLRRRGLPPPAPGGRARGREAPQRGLEAPRPAPAAPPPAPVGHRPAARRRLLRHRWGIGRRHRWRRGGRHRRRVPWTRRGHDERCQRRRAPRRPG